MHIRTVKAKSGQRMRRYTQLVQSYRRDDGMPATKVIANLGQLANREIENLRLALKASREGKALILPTDLAAQRVRVRANLDYLDVAVALELWNSWKLTELINRLLPGRSDVVPASEVIAALTIQRCVAPRSKFYAQRWFPRTALPELLDLDPRHFNNSRFHRVLEQLDGIDDQLQEALPRRYEHKDGTFSALFVDVTDAWFEGRGCDLAERDRTKEGLRNRHKIGIVLLCNELGYPMRWKVLPGKTRDPQALRGIVGDIEKLPWVSEVPIVFDRAMGTAGAVARLLESKLHFITAARRSEIGSYTDALPSQGLEEIDAGDDEEARKRNIERAAQVVEEAGMHRVHDHLFVLDLGANERVLTFARSALPETGAAWDPSELTGAAAWLAQARIHQARLDSKEFPTRAALAAELGVTRARMTQILNTLKLDPQLQEELLAGVFGHVSEHTLRAIVRLGAWQKQRRALEEHALTARPAPSSRSQVRRTKTGRQRTRVRLVAYFNPQMFVDQRETAARQLQQVEDFIADLNRRLRSSRRKPRSKENVQAEVINKLASLSMLRVFQRQFDELTDDSTGARRLHITLHFNEAEWKKRRQRDGFVLLVAHPDLPHSGLDIVQLYRDKDAVEKDFQTIKSVMKLRPIYHYTDPKVRAHVTLCMLGLLLERTLEKRLRRSQHPLTAPACFEELASGHLNMLSTDLDLSPTYAATEPTEAQRAILKSLRMAYLTDEQKVAARIHPREAG